MIEHIGSGQRSLFLRIAPGFQPDPPAAIDRQREGAAIARREDMGSRRPETFVDGNAVLDPDPCLLGKGNIRHGTDTHEDEIGLDHFSIRKVYDGLAARISL
jgi:hypothetical protein